MCLPDSSSQTLRSRRQVGKQFRAVFWHGRWLLWCQPATQLGFGACIPLNVRIFHPTEPCSVLLLFPDHVLSFTPKVRIFWLRAFWFRLGFRSAVFGHLHCRAHKLIINVVLASQELVLNGPNSAASIAPHGPVHPSIGVLLVDAAFLAQIVFPQRWRGAKKIKRGNIAVHAQL